MPRHIHIHIHRPTRDKRRMQKDVREEYGVRWREAGKSGAITTKEKLFDTAQALDRFVDKLDQRDGFIEVVSFLRPNVGDKRWARDVSSEERDALERELDILERETAKLDTEIDRKDDQGQPVAELRKKMVAIVARKQEIRKKLGGVGHDRKARDCTCGGAAKDADKFESRYDWMAAVKAKHPKALFSTRGDTHIANLPPQESGRSSGEEVGRWNQHSKVGSTLDASAEELVGKLVKFEPPHAGTSGKMKAAGTVKRVMPDGRIEVKAQQGGYHILAISQVEVHA